MPASPDPSGDLARRFGENLRRERRRAGYSQEELGFLASLHRTELGMLERGIRLPRLDTIVKLLGALDAEANDLIVGMQWTVGGVRPRNSAVDPAEPRPSPRLPRDPLGSSQ